MLIQQKASLQLQKVCREAIYLALCLYAL